MGRKRNQGKARKATKEAKAKRKEEADAEAEAERNNRMMNNGQQHSSASQEARSGAEQQSLLRSVTSRLRINEVCYHGLDTSNTLSSGGVGIIFLDKCTKAFKKAKRSKTVPTCLEEAKNTTWDEFAELWEDAAKLKMAMSFLLCNGTQKILNGNFDSARNDATIARYFEQHIAVELKQSQALFNWPKTEETFTADMHTLVKFFRHRIPCSCLDKKYQEVKSITKLGLCHNLQCKNRRVERSNTMYCSRCRCATYCSRECQEADWTYHKPRCDECAEIIAKFEAKQQK